VADVPSGPSLDSTPHYANLKIFNIIIDIKETEWVVFDWVYLA
jgi:hypothetical protein